MNILKASIAIGVIAVLVSWKSQPSESKDYPKALADFEDFKTLVEVVDEHRQERLIDLNTFLKMSEEENVVILDTRSDMRYERKHIKGAIHLDFTDFTQSTLQELIPDPNTKILIYCNNNFRGDQIDFASKMVMPERLAAFDNSILTQKRPLTLALNIPTYINLYGYGYQNVYELDELVAISDPRIEFEGREVN